MKIRFVSMVQMESVLYAVTEDGDLYRMYLERSVHDWKLFAIGPGKVVAEESTKRPKVRTAGDGQ